MLAKLFDDISLGSLVRAILFSLLILVAMVIFSPRPEVSIASFWATSTIDPIWVYVFLFINVLFSAWWFNTYINQFDLLRNGFQLMVVFSFLAVPPLLPNFSLSAILMLPLVVVLISRLLSLANRPDISHLLFDSGNLVGVMLFINPHYVIFLIIIWLAMMSYGRLGLKEMIMPVVGITAVWFLVVSLVYWWQGPEALWPLFQSFTRIRLGLIPQIPSGWWRILPVVLLLIPAIIELWRIYPKAKVYRRQSFTFLILLFLTILLAGGILHGATEIWLWLVLPVSVGLVNYLQQLKRSWMKEVVYLLLLFYLLFFIL